MRPNTGFKVDNLLNIHQHVKAGSEEAFFFFHSLIEVFLIFKIQDLHMWSHMNTQNKGTGEGLA